MRCPSLAQDRRLGRASRRARGGVPRPGKDPDRTAVAQPKPGHVILDGINVQALKGSPAMAMAARYVRALADGAWDSAQHPAATANRRERPWAHEPDEPDVRRRRDRACFPRALATSCQRGRARPLASSQSSLPKAGSRCSAGGPGEPRTERAEPGLRFAASATAGHSVLPCPRRRRRPSASARKAPRKVRTSCSFSSRRWKMSRMFRVITGRLSGG